MSSASAGLVYNEAVDGDLNFSSLTLSTGVNTVSGTTVASGGIDGHDYDDFRFEVGAGMQVVSVSLAGTVGSQFAWEFWDDGFGGTNSLGTVSLAAPPDMLANVPLAGGDDYYVFQFLLDNLPAATAAYTWTFVVRDIGMVPEPAPLLIAGLGLGLIALRRRGARV